jgi:hypothetical protein
VHWDRVSCRGQAFQGIFGRVAASVGRQRLPVGNKRQRPTVLGHCLVAFDRDRARRQCMAVHRKVFEMQHSFRLRRVIPGQRLFVVSTLFCKKERKEGVSHFSVSATTSGREIINLIGVASVICYMLCRNKRLL